MKNENLQAQNLGKWKTKCNDQYPKYWIDATVLVWKVTVRSLWLLVFGLINKAEYANKAKKKKKKKKKNHDQILLFFPRRTFIKYVKYVCLQDQGIWEIKK